MTDDKHSRQMKLSNNTILITGGTSGIGLELGKSLMELGNRVILLGRDRVKLDKLKLSGFSTVKCDLANIDEIDAASIYIQNTFPEINILINNAGIQYNYDFVNEINPLQKINREIMINLTGQIMLTQLLIPMLHVADKALIINTTSGLGAFPKGDGLVYSAGKAGMRNFTIGLRYSLKKSNIRVAELIPPVTETGMTKDREGQKISAKALVKKIIPQLKNERKILTLPKMRIFLWIAFFFPKLAYKIVSRP